MDAGREQLRDAINQANCVWSHLKNVGSLTQFTEYPEPDGSGYCEEETVQQAWVETTELGGVAYYRSVTGAADNRDIVLLPTEDLELAESEGLSLVPRLQ